MVEFHKPTDEAIKFIAENMRDGDAAEIRASGHDDLHEALKMSMKLSKYSTIVVAGDGIPLAVFGLVEAALLTRSAAPWFISSKFALEHRREFLTTSKQGLQEMLDLYPRLVNYVHADNRISIRWLKWMGFTIEEPVPAHYTGEMFHRFYMER